MVLLRDVILYAIFKIYRLSFNGGIDVPGIKRKHTYRID